MAAKSGDTVKVHYKGTLESGEVFDSSEGREPLEFTMGAGQMIPGFEKGVMGMELEESKTINIPAAEAYGERREDLLHQVPKTQLPSEVQPEVGMRLYSQMPTGEQIPLQITEVQEEFVVVDANHELAGKNLVFEMTLVGIG